MAIAPFPIPAHQTERADFRHSAFRLASPQGPRWSAALMLVPSDDTSVVRASTVYRFKKGAWPEMILQAVMRAARDSEAEKRQHGAPLQLKPDGGKAPQLLPPPDARVRARNGAAREESKP